MNIDKYIELLRFYITEKLDKTNNVLQKTITDELNDIISSILAALFSFYLSENMIATSGVCGIIFRIALIIVLYFLVKFIVIRVRKYFKTKKFIQKINNENVDFAEAMSYVNKFDHVACDGVLLAWDFLSRYETMCNINEIENEETIASNESLFYLIEAFYYYKKSLNIVAIIVKYSVCCINGNTVSNGISYYRLINVYNSLCEINKKIKSYVKSLDFEHKAEFLNEMELSNRALDSVTNFINKNNGGIKYE